MKQKRKHSTRAVSSAAIAVFGITAFAAAPGAMAAGGKPAGKYVTGDFHNHTTCSDGSLSVRKLVNKSVDVYGLDWFTQAGHGGNGSRNCTLTEDPLDDPTYPAEGQPAASGKGPNQLWTNTIGNAQIKGDVSGPATARNMWRWQIMQDYMYPVLEDEARKKNKPIFIGLEQVVPGHEHSSTAVIDGQLPAGYLSATVAAPAGNATAMSMFEYCFDRADADTSRGNFLGTTGPNNWDCSVTGSANNGLLDPAARKILNNVGTAGHIKTIEGVKWQGVNFPMTSYNIPAHLERAGAFNPTASRGYNIEHLRDYNNAAPTVAFGFESMPGHQAESNRGSYSTGAVGGGTYGSTGIYAAAIGGVWDALLGEGRNWFFFASSDYHNRGSFGPDVRQSTADFFPGEYTKDYVMVRNGAGKVTPQGIVDGLRSGNSFVANGDLIDRLAFVACVSYPGVAPRSNAAVEALAAAAAAGSTDVNVSGCATMGEKLVVRPGADIVVSIVVRDPQGTNHSPYSFPNPSLVPLGITQPLNAPVLDHIDVIGGKVTGYVAPGSPNYAGLLGSPAATNPTAALARTFGPGTWTALPDGTRKMTYRITGVKDSQYVRLRGTNLPAGTPNETDAAGNPLNDFVGSANILCSDAACPAHMATNAGGAKLSSFDVSGWADLWFYSNPIFVQVAGSTAVAGIK